ncbi:MAG: hypothetical protein GWN31_07765 [Candidatus Thorarchaeota archaeon]|nr:hypothetical protein [Candidatus Thorarchaeota archaeon]NIW13812.1 hypothetical protein [Candidatus Thorarchaeota archaeon]NIW51943.1 hypothetical protein [Candidatus Korarchaeota archaeon]
MEYEDTLAETFSRAPTFTLISIENGEPSAISVINNKASEYSQGAGPLAAKTLKENGVTVILSRELGPGAKTILQTLGIDFYQAEIGKTVKEVLNEWLIFNRLNL